MKLPRKAAALVLIAAAAACAGPEVRDVQPQSPFAAEARALYFRGDSFYYIDRGSGDAVLLIHGFGGSAYSFRKVVEPLSRTHRVLVPDLLGFGFSDRPDIEYGMDLYADQIRYLLDRLGIERAHIVGNSMGGRVALTFAARYPQRARSITLLNAAVYPQKGEGERPALFRLGALPCMGTLLSPFVTRGRVRGILKDVYHDDNGFTDGDVEAYYFPLTRSGAFRAPIGLLRTGHRNRVTTEHLARIVTPTLVLWGKHDPWFPLPHGERLAREVKGARLVVIENAAHVPQEETPDRVLGELAQFWSALPK